MPIAMIPNLEKITAKNAWKFALHCDHQVFDGTAVEQSARLNEFYNFSKDLSSALLGANFVHEFCHVVYPLALEEMQNNPIYAVVDIPFDYPGNGNFLAETFADAIQIRLLKRPENAEADWALFRGKIDDYAIAVALDRSRTKHALESVEFQLRPITIFEASREYEFEEDTPLMEGEELPDFTIWGERIRPEISPDDLDVMARQIYEITTPVVHSIRQWLDVNDGEYLTRTELRETIDDALKTVKMSDLRQLIRPNKNTTPQSLITYTI